MIDDPRIVKPEERLELARKLEEIDPRLVDSFEGEVIDPYKTTLQRIKLAGFELKWPLKKTISTAKLNLM